MEECKIESIVSRLPFYKHIFNEQHKQTEQANRNQRTVIQQKEIFVTKASKESGRLQNRSPKGEMNISRLKESYFYGSPTYVKTFDEKQTNNALFE